MTLEARRVGPFRLERKLGSGGMGVVYAAWDERLERRVALKRIRSEVAGDPQRRERFRREARAVAKLDHPNVVRIYDLLETPDGDWLVLQYVEGLTLAERLRRSPLSPEEVAALGRDVLSALAAAHAESLLHRDLKAENVVLTPSGRALVLDFGLATLCLPEAGVDTGASFEGGIAGTYRAMSPEQANGLPLDPRSDLFSLGVLLYEAATGDSPFRAETPVETLTRVCTHLQPPARDLAPALPGSLSRWIDALLEKEAYRRPRSAAEALVRLETIDLPDSIENQDDLAPTVVAAAIPPRALATGSSSSYRGYRRLRYLPILAVGSLSIGLGLFAAWRFYFPRPPLYVAVARPEIGLGARREEVTLAASAFQAAALRTLSSLEGIAALTPGAAEYGEPLPSVPKLARLLAADEVLTSSLECREHDCLGTLRRFRGSDGKLLDIRTFEVPLDDFRLLDTAAATYLRRSYGGFETRPGAGQLRVRSEDYQRYLRVQRVWEEKRPADLEPLFAELSRIRASSPSFVDAYLLEARLAGRRFFETRDPEDLDRALGLIEQARSLAPEDPSPLAAWVQVALPAGRPDEAEKALNELERLEPGDAWTLHRRAFLSEQRGERSLALRQLRAAVARHPSAQFSIDLANLEMRLGEIPAARLGLEDLLRRFPGHPGAEKLLAQLELEVGNPSRAADLYAHLVSRRPGFAELSNLGVAELLLGRYRQAAESQRRAAALAPKSAVAVLNLADAEALLGHRTEAEILYARVLELVAEDPAPNFWQTLSIKAQAQAHLGRAPDAAASIQKAIVAAPDNPQVAFEASLVYVLIGDSASALASAARALSSGYERRWFHLPWFEPLRREPAFRKLIDPADRLSRSAAR